MEWVSNIIQISDIEGQWQATKIKGEGRERALRALAHASEPTAPSPNPLPYSQCVLRVFRRLCHLL